ncbi:MAG TPA: AlpA family phage regulatory protein [Reyranella sp.]|nr:AlpA family phage regulatory protein [Reyranella sp.]
MIDQSNTNDDDAALRLPEVIRRTGLSRSEIYRRIKAGTFPQPQKRGPKINVWRLGAIRAFNTNPNLDAEACELI